MQTLLHESKHVITYYSIMLKAQQKNNRTSPQSRSNSAPAIKPKLTKRVIAIVGGTIVNGRLATITDVVVDSGTSNYKIYIDIPSGTIHPLVNTTTVVCV